MVARPAPADDTRQAIASVLDHDPELAAAVPRADFQIARRAMAGPLLTWPAGADAQAELARHVTGEAWGVFLASGLAARTTRLGRSALFELVGGGELVTLSQSEDGCLPVAESLRVVEHANAIVLGRLAIHAMGRWPALLRVVEQRRDAQRRRASAMAVISQLPNVETRLLAALCHLGDTWGKATPEGTIVPFPLTHELLGQFVAARRPTVTLAAQQLAESDRVRRMDDGTWLVRPGAPETLAAELSGQDVAGATVPPRTEERDGRIVRAQNARQRSKELVSDSSALIAEANQLERRLGVSDDDAPAPDRG